MTTTAHPAASHRRGASSTRIPVHLPLVEVDVAHDGRLTVRVDHQPHSVDADSGALRRGDLKQVVEEIAADLRTAVRVEVHETDGSTFTDIITATPDDLAAATPEPRAPAPPMGISTDGFAPGERVEVCIVVARQSADENGRTHLRLPPALLAKHLEVVAVGLTSGVVTVTSGAT